MDINVLYTAIVRALVELIIKLLNKWYQKLLDIKWNKLKQVKKVIDLKQKFIFISRKSNKDEYIINKSININENISNFNKNSCCSFKDFDFVFSQQNLK